MGYVFDAMKRSGDGGGNGEQHPAPQQHSPQPPPAEEPPVFSLADAVREDMDQPPLMQRADVPNKVSQVPQSRDAQDVELTFPEPAALQGGGRSELPGEQSMSSNHASNHAPPLRIQRSGESNRNADDRMVVLLSPSDVLSEEYRGIRTGLLARWHHKRHLIHTITSATPQEGKTITSLNLGLSLSELQDRRILVVEADLRLPQFRKLLDMPERPGLTNVLRGEAPIEQAIQTIEETGMDIVCAGARASNDAVQLLSSQKMSSLMKLLRRKYDHVIIDTPPIVELADAGILGAQSDDVLMIVRMERTPRPLVEQAVRTLESYNAPVAGMIATNQNRGRGKYYNYRYGYRYRYRYTERKAA